MARTKIIHVAVKSDMYRQYKAIAEMEDVPVAVIVRRALAEYLPAVEEFLALASKAKAS